MRVLLISILLLLPMQVFALDCDQAITTLDITYCAKLEQEQVEKELNQVYQRVLINIKAMDENPETALQDHIAHAFISAQRQWVKLREADCKNVYNYWSGGTIRNLMYLDCMQSMAKQRIKLLKKYEPK